MKRIVLRTLIIGSVGFLLPLIVLAAGFVGPTAQPPSGNVPGVIWNMAGTSQIQTGAEINIGGKATFNDTMTSNVDGILNGNNYLQNGKAFHIDNSPTSTYSMGNWLGTSNLPFTFNLFGDLLVNDFGGSLGQRGRVQATEFCFNPGAPTDCATSWSGLGTNYVLKTGDTMSGTLTVNTASSVGVSSTGAINGGVFKGIGGYGITGDGVNGGYFTGSTFGLGAKNKNNGSLASLGLWSGEGVFAAGPTAGVLGQNASSSGSIGKLGTVGYGVEGQGPTAGVYAVDSDSGSYAYIGTGNFGGTFYGNSYGVEGSGATYGLRGTDNTSFISGYVGRDNYSFYGSGDIYIGGTAYKSGSLAWQAPSDARLKTILGDFSYGLDEIGCLQVKRFKYKEGNAMNLPTDEDYVGFVAQDVEKVIPEAVKEVDGYKTIEADPIIWAMLNSIKELKAKNEALEQRVNDLDKRIQELESK